MKVLYVDDDMIHGHTEFKLDGLFESKYTVEVVRCKDCKYMLDSDKGFHFCNVWCKVNGLGDNGYCSYGKRKDDKY